MFKDNDWVYISNYLKKSYRILPSDYVNDFSNKSRYEVSFNSNKLVIGYESGLEQVLDNIDFSYVMHDALKIGFVLNKGHLVYSNKSGMFKVYFIDYRNIICECNFEYVCDTFTELISMSDNVKTFFKDKAAFNDEVQKMSIEQIGDNILSGQDFALIKNMLKSIDLPQDFVDIFKIYAKFKYKVNESLILTFGADSGRELCLSYNSMAIAMPHSTLVIGIDGYGNSILYSNKDGSYKLYIVSDSLFEESSFFYLADNLYELLIDKKNMDILLNF